MIGAPAGIDVLDLGSWRLRCLLHGRGLCSGVALGAGRSATRIPAVAELLQLVRWLRLVAELLLMMAVLLLGGRGGRVLLLVMVLLELLIELALELQKAELVLLQLVVSGHCDPLATRDCLLTRRRVILLLLLLLLLLLMKTAGTARYVVVRGDRTVFIRGRLAAIK